MSSNQLDSSAHSTNCLYYSCISAAPTHDCTRSSHIRLHFPPSYYLLSHTLTNTPIPGNYRFAIHFATMGNTDHAIQRFGFAITEALLHTLHIPTTTTTFRDDEHGHEWPAHYDDYERPCPHNWPHGRHWQWAPRNISTTYARPPSKRHTCRIRQLILQHCSMNDAQ